MYITRNTERLASATRGRAVLSSIYLARAGVRRSVASTPVRCRTVALFSTHYTALYTVFVLSHVRCAVGCHKEASMPLSLASRGTLTPDPGPVS